MEQNLPIITKKVWKMMKLALVMLRKGICKKKLMLELNLMMKRAKIAANPQEYEFSCKNTPLYRHYFNKPKTNADRHFIVCSPANFKDQFEYEAVNKVLDSMTASSKQTVINQRRQRQLSITDSPFQLQAENNNNNNNNNQYVDAAADDFIKRFYSQLMLQDC